MTKAQVIPVGQEPLPLDDGSAADLPGARRPLRTASRRRGAVRRRFGLLNAVVDRALPGRSRTELAAWMLLFRHAGPDGVVTASVADLARRAACSVRGLRYALGRLRDAGLLQLVKRGTLAGGPSVWRLLLPEGDRP